MKKISAILALFAALLLMAAPVVAQTDDSLGYEQPTEEPTVEPGGGTEEPSEEPTVDERDEVQDQEELADTGVDSVMLAGVGGGLLLAGAVALLAARRPRRSSHR